MKDQNIICTIFPSIYMLVVKIQKISQKKIRKGKPYLCSSGNVPNPCRPASNIS